MRCDLPTNKSRQSEPENSSVQGAILLEVLLALALFVAAATVVTTALSASLASVERQKLACHAMNIAASALAEVEIGIRPAASESPKALESPFEDWTVELIVTAVDTGSPGAVPATRLEVVVRHQKSSMVQRMAELRPVSAGEARPSDSPAASRL